MSDDNVDYRLRNVAKINEACKVAQYDEAVICGNLRCTSCKHEFMSLAVVPDWALSPTSPLECDKCGKRASVYKLDSALVRIPSRRQEGLENG